MFYSFDVVMCYSIVSETSLFRIITHTIRFLCIPAASFNSSDFDFKSLPKIWGDFITVLCREGNFTYKILAFYRYFA